MIDCHIHFDPSLITARDMIKSMDAFGIEKAALIAPLCPDLAPTILTRFGTPVFRSGITSNIGPVRRLMRKMYQGWVKPDNKVDVGGKEVAVMAQPDNSLVADALKQHEDRFLGWIFVNPQGPVLPVDEIERYAKTPGMIGVKAHPFWNNTSVSRLVDAAALCREKGLAMLIHMGTGQSGDFKLLPEKFPEVNFIYAHAGIPYQKAVWEYVRSKDNAYIDLSAPAYVDVKIATRALASAGADKCLFGSDGPYFHHENGQYDYGECLSILKATGLAKQEMEQVGGRNFLKVIRMA